MKPGALSGAMLRQGVVGSWARAAIVARVEIYGRGVPKAEARQGNQGGSIGACPTWPIHGRYQSHSGVVDSSAGTGVFRVMKASIPGDARACRSRCRLMRS